MSALKVRRANAEDAAALEHIGRATFLEAFADFVAGADLMAHLDRQYDRTKIAQWLNSAGWAAWLAETAKLSPVGFLLLCPPDMPIATHAADDIEIKRIYLFSHYHGSGIAAEMVQAALDHARQAGKKRVLLGVNVENFRALGFYRKMGFETIGTRNFIVGTEVHDDYIMARSF